MSLPRLKDVARRAFVGSGMQRLRERFGSRAVVGIYHGVAERDIGAADGGFIRKDEFVRHLRFYQRSRKVVTLAEVTAAIASGRRLDPRWIVVTIDDAFAETVDLVADVMGDLHLPWVLNVPAGLVDTPGTLWPQELRIAALAFGPELAAALPADDTQGMDSCSASQRLDAANRLVRKLKRVPASQRQSLHAQAIASIGPDRWREAIDHWRHYRIVSSTILRQVSESGVEIGAHGYWHEALNDCVDVVTLEREVVDSRRRLAELTGVAPRHFAFPFGLECAMACDAVASAGYSAALTSRHHALGSYGSRAIPFLPRVVCEWPLLNLRMILTRLS